MISELVRGISVMVHGEEEMKRRDSRGFGKRMHVLVRSGYITEEQAWNLINRATKWDSDQAHIGYYEGTIECIAEMSKLASSSLRRQPPLEVISSLPSINPRTYFNPGRLG